MGPVLITGPWVSFGLGICVPSFFIVIGLCLPVQIYRDVRCVKSMQDVKPDFFRGKDGEYPFFTACHNTVSKAIFRGMV